jgi:subtilisin family serine protease
MSEPVTWVDRMSQRPTDKSIDEVNYIIKAFTAANTPIDVGENGDGSIYLYATQRLLVRFEYVDEVLKIIRREPGSEKTTDFRSQPGLLESVTVGEGEGGITVEPLIDGVVLLKLGRREIDLLRVLNDIDEKLGEGAATPDQVLTVANGASPGGEVGPCPATEPQEVYDGIGPFPPLCQGSSGAGVKVYVADTGWVAPPAWVGTWLAGVSGQKDPNTPAPPPPGMRAEIRPYAAHGTFVAGLVRAMAPQADIWVENIFKIAGSQLESRAVRKLREALRDRPEVDIFHVSVAAATRRHLLLIAFGKWLDRLDQRKGVVCVAPAGNNTSGSPHWPGAFPSVVSVGALAMDWRSRAYFTNYGRWVDAYAPGTNLINAYTRGDYECHVQPYTNTHRIFNGLAQWSGTSFSTPLVTGLIAARMTRSGQSAEQAAACLLAEARRQSAPGTGPILLPCCDDGSCADPGQCCDRPRCRPDPC